MAAVEESLAAGQGVAHLQPGPPTAVLLARLDAAGFDAFQVDGLAVHDKASALQTIARAGSFPDWFGHNLDALADALDDLSWRPGERHGVVVTHAAQVRRAAPDVLDVVVEVARASSGRLVVVLVD